MPYLLSFDLGTGGVKVSLFGEDGQSLCGVFREYPTYYENSFQEQEPESWWNEICDACRELWQRFPQAAAQVAGIGISGHSLGVVALDENGELVWKRTPIWSDNRAGKQAQDFFQKVSEKEWYTRTGNGFPAGQYPLFKILWYRENDPDRYQKAACFMGTKDYINYHLTGVMATDPSYASGSGAYDLKQGGYISEYLQAAGISPSLLPKIVPSHSVLGTLTADAAQKLGLPDTVQVVCGGVDNACMALGAGCFSEGSSYISAGTSAWIAVCSQEPVLDFEKKPYVFTHCVPGYHVSATCIFSAGRSLQWMRDVLCQNLTQTAEQQGCSVYRVMDELAEQSPVGAKGLLFNPSLSGGSSLAKSPMLRGSFSGLTLAHTQGDMIRAVMEGVCLDLRLALDVLERFAPVKQEMLLVGGGGKSPLWRQIYADAFEKTILQTEVGQDAGALGAAALAAVGCGLWEDFTTIAGRHQNPKKVFPKEENSAVYRRYLPVFQKLADVHSETDTLLNT